MHLNAWIAILAPRHCSNALIIVSGHAGRSFAHPGAFAWLYDRTRQNYALVTAGWPRMRLSWNHFPERWDIFLTFLTGKVRKVRKNSLQIISFPFSWVSFPFSFPFFCVKSNVMQYSIVFHEILFMSIFDCLCKFMYAVVFTLNEMNQNITTPGPEYLSQEPKTTQTTCCISEICHTAARINMNQNITNTPGEPQDTLVYLTTAHQLKQCLLPTVGDYSQ